MSLLDLLLMNLFMAFTALALVVVQPTELTGLAAVGGALVLFLGLVLGYVSIFLAVSWVGGRLVDRQLAQKRD